jgi:hypothetical protein
MFRKDVLIGTILCASSKSAPDCLHVHVMYSLQTALMYAAAVGSEPVMLTLLKAGAARAVIDAQVGLMHRTTTIVCALRVLAVTVSRAVQTLSSW